MGHQLWKTLRSRRRQKREECAPGHCSLDESTFFFRRCFFLRARCLLPFGQHSFLIIPSLMLVIYHSVLSLTPLRCLRNSRPSSWPVFRLRATNGEKSERESKNNVFRRRRMGKSKRRGANGIDKLKFKRTTINFIKSTLKGREEREEQDGDSTGNNNESFSSEPWLEKSRRPGMLRTSDTRLRVEHK